MPTSGSADLLVDTSVAVALVLEDHEQHRVVTEAVGTRRVGLAGYAAFETFSVLTRLPPPARRRPEVVGRLLAAGFPATRFLAAEGAARLLEELTSLGISGGRVYDALVGATAATHGLPLASRDAGALDTYRALGVELELMA